MSLFGELERFLSEVVYPHRWPILAGILTTLAAFPVFAYLRGWHRNVWRHRLATALVVIPLVAAAIPVGDYLLPSLWERSYLEEPSPLVLEGGAAAPAPSATPRPTTEGEPTPTPPGSPEPTPTDTPLTPRVRRLGQFHGADDFHFGSGQALLIETAPRRYTLRFEEFSVRNGPDLFVYLSPDPEGSNEGALNLGGLKATDGAFNYEVPAGADVSQFKSAIVWCRRFSVLFAVAPLLPA